MLAGRLMTRRSAVKRLYDLYWKIEQMRLMANCYGAKSGKYVTRAEASATMAGALMSRRSRWW